MPVHPDRIWRLQGASNFRDLGGYRGHGGRATRWRRLFRSDQLGNLTQDDRTALEALGLGASIDFRGVSERASATYSLAGVAQHSLAIEPTVAQRMHELVASGRPITAQIAIDLMGDLYRAFVHDQAHRFAEFFELLLNSQRPVVFHCTAGKDRTGFAAALFLLALGVDRDVVMQDYLLSNDVFRPPPLPPGNAMSEALAVMWRVEAGFLNAALQAVDADHGGVDRYLQQRLGLGPAALETLADRYLQIV